MTVRIAVLPSVQRARRVQRAVQREPVRFPRAEETAYVAALYSLAQSLTMELRRDVLPRLVPLCARTERRLPRTDDRGERLASFMADLKGAFNIATKTARTVASRMLEAVSGQHAAEFGDKYRGVIRVNPALGGEKWLAHAMELATERNVALIESLPLQLRSEAQKVISDGVMAGRLHAEIADQLVQRAGVIESRAILIARDQVGKWHGDLQRLRQIDAGVVAYEWSTSRDERVRRRHQMMEGRRCRWADPPAVGPRGEALHPGQDVLCRCVAVPLPDEDGAPEPQEGPMDAIQSFWHWAK